MREIEENNVRKELIERRIRTIIRSAAAEQVNIIAPGAFALNVAVLALPRPTAVRAQILSE